MKSLGFSYDWTRELSTTDESYFKWTQWIFLQLFKSGLAAQSEVSVNWCPKLGTVLANEEVINGLSERGDFPVVRMPLRQWILKITHYADRLAEDLSLIQWPEGTLTAQNQWIGRSVGAQIGFSLKGTGVSEGTKIEVFTTRPDTLMGVTYIILAPEHSLVESLTTADQADAITKYKQTITGKSDMERTAVGKDKGKTGVFTGSYAIHPISGEQVPIWIADYVLAGYGTGAVMAVPAHDERDFEFATIFNLPIKQVVQLLSGDAGTEADALSSAMCEKGTVCNSGADFDGLTSDEAKVKMISTLKSIDMGDEKVTYKLRDWVFSRQRYWGEPIPIYFPVEMIGEGSPIDGAEHRICYETPIAVEESELPLKLPDLSDFSPGDDPQGCLARAKDWRYFQKDGQWFARETNTMPQWAGSCWYYLRFADPTCTEKAVSDEAAEWLPVDLYVGGQEHAVLHLLYARFWHKVLYDIGVVKDKEPFLKLVHQGMILGMDGEKMSKSRGNVINPDDIVQEYGADALRLYEMFMGPLEAVKPWQTGQLMGVVRFRDRVLSVTRACDQTLTELPAATTTNPEELALLKTMHKTIKKVTEDIEKLSFNTAIAQLMVLNNAITSAKCPVSKPMVEKLVLLLSPFAPHVAEECWSFLGNSKTLAYEAWPDYDEQLCYETRAVIAIQVNGKVRGKVEMEKDSELESVLSEAMVQANVLKFTEGLKIKKTIYVPGKILNILV